MMKRMVALNAVAIAAVALTMVSCNFMMPTPNYPVMSQEEGVRIIASYYISLDDRVNNPRFSFGTVDGMSAYNGPSPGAYIGLTKEYSKSWAIIYLSPGAEPVVIYNTFLTFDFDRILAINAPGFIGREDINLREIYWDGFSLMADPLDTIGNIESFAFYSMSPLRALASNKFASLASGTRGVFDEGTDLSVQGFGSLPASDTHTLINTYPDIKATISGSFSILRDDDSASAFFWNRGQFEVRKSGFTESGGFTWLEARRFDTVSEKEEILVVSLPDGASPPVVRSVRPVGTVGDYVLTIDKKSDIVSEFVALDAKLDKVGSISIYGLDVILLGEAEVMVGTELERCAIFATLGIGGGEKRQTLVVTLYAYPIRLFTGGTP